MNILILNRILFNMTYEEYKSNKDKKNKSNSILKKLLGKLFTIVIFTMLIIILSNYSEKFRNFLINDVLNSTMDFSKVNNIIDKTTSVFKSKEVQSVSKVDIKNAEKYKDGVKYIIKDNENIYLKDSGIVTFIGYKEGYGNTIIVQQSNGYYAWYGNIKESVKLYDYVESGDVIGVGSKEYYYVLLKDDKIINVLDES